MEFNPIEMANNEAPQLQNMVSDIRTKLTPTQQDQTFNDLLNSVYTGSDDIIGGVGIAPTTQKLKLTDEVSIEETHALVGNEWLKKYPSYKLGRDNAEFAAQNQSALDQAFNGTLKALSNVGTTILGNTAGFIYGIGAAASEGNFNSVFDNSFSESVYEWNKKLNYQLPNYYTKEAQNSGFFGQLIENPTNTIFNDVFNGLSFTVGTIASEAIWAYATGGASIALRMGQNSAKAANAGRWSKMFLGAEKVADGVKGYKTFVNTPLYNAVRTGAISTKQARNAATIGNVINTSRFIATSSGNEAGIEAFHFKKEAVENFDTNFQKMYGREATEQEKADFSKDVEDAATGVFLGNMAVLGVSNLAMIGGIFGIKSPIRDIQKSINKKVFGVGVDKTDGKWQALAPSKVQKVSRVLYTPISNMLTEGVFEEGGQGVISGTASNWVERRYDPKYVGKVVDIMDAAVDAAKHQYGTKEGMKEVWLGTVIGLIGGKISGQYSRFSDMQKQMEEGVSKSLNAQENFLTTFQGDLTAKRITTTALQLESQDRAEKAMAKGEVIEAKLAQYDGLIAGWQLEDTFGDSQDLTEKLKLAVDTAEITDQEKTDFKTAIDNLYETYKEANSFAEAIVGGQGQIYGSKHKAQHAKEALAYVLIQGKNSNMLMDEVFSEMKQYLNDDLTKAVKVSEDLTQLGKETRKKLSTASQRYRNLEDKSKAVQQKVRELQAKPKEIEGDRQSKLVEMQNKLIEIEDEKTALRLEIEGIHSNMKQGNKFQSTLKGTSEVSTDFDSEFISVDDLINLDEKLKELEASYQTMKQLNPTNAEKVKDLMDKYQKAKKSLLDYNGAASIIAQGKFQPRLKQGNPFAKTVADANDNSFTSMFLDDLIRVRNEKTSTYVSNTQKDEIIKLQKRLDELSQKNKEDLTEEEIEEIEKLERTIATLESDAVTPTQIDDNTPSVEDYKKKKVEALNQQLITLEEELANTPQTTEVSNKVLVSNLKVGDKFSYLDKDGKVKTYTVKEKVDNIGSVEQIITEEGVTLTNPSSLVSTAPKSSWTVVKVDSKVTKSDIEAKKADIGKALEDLKDYFLNNTRSTTDFKFKPDLDPTPLFALYDELMSIGADKIVAHGMAKNSVGQQFKDLLNILQNGTDPSINQGELFTAPIVVDKELAAGAGSGLGTAGGTSYNDGGFQIVAKKGVSNITSINDIGGILVNEGMADALPELITKLRMAFPNLAIEKYSDAVKLVKALEEQTTQTEETTSQPQENPQYKDLQNRITNLKREIAKLSPPNLAPIDAVEFLEQRVRDVLKFFKADFVGTDDINEKIKNRPDQKDIDRYRELLDKEETASDEFQALKAKLSQWRVFDSLMENEEESVADLLDQIAALKEIVEEEKTLTEVVAESDDLNTNKSDKKDDFSLTQNTNFPPTLKVKKDGAILLTHLNVEDLLQKFGAVTALKINGKAAKVEQLKDLKVKDKVTFKDQSGTLRAVNISVGKSLEMAREDFLAIPDIITSSGLTAKSVNWSYSVLYETDALGQVVPMKSSFEDGEVTGHSNNLKQGDTIEMYVNVNNAYNQDLLKKYKNGEITFEELRNQVVVFIRKDRENYSTLKGMNDRVDPDDTVVTIRKAAAERLISGKSGQIGTTKIERVELGVPIFSLNEQGGIKYLPITEAGLTNVEATGYIENGELKLSKELEDVRKSLVSVPSSKNKDKQIPVVVIKQGKQLIAFPIKLIKQPAPKGADMDAILSNMGLSDSQKLVEINKLLAFNKISPRKFNLTTLNDTAKLEQIREALEAVEDFANASDLAQKGYDKNNLQNIAEISLDLKDLNVYLPSQKLRISFEDANLLGVDDVVEVKKKNESVTKQTNDNISKEDFTEPKKAKEKNVRASITIENEDALNKIKTTKLFTEIFSPRQLEELKVGENISSLPQSNFEKAQKVLGATKASDTRAPKSSISKVEVKEGKVKTTVSNKPLIEVKEEDIIEVVLTEDVSKYTDEQARVVADKLLRGKGDTSILTEEQLELYLKEPNQVKQQMDAIKKEQRDAAPKSNSAKKENDVFDPFTKERLTKYEALSKVNSGEDIQFSLKSDNFRNNKSFFRVKGVWTQTIGAGQATISENKQGDKNFLESLYVRVKSGEKIEAEMYDDLKDRFSIQEDIDNSNIEC